MCQHLRRSCATVERLPASGRGQAPIALPSAEHCRCIVSWNFRHIVHFDKIPLYNGGNLINAFDGISINTPAEVIACEK